MNSEDELFELVDAIQSKEESSGYAALTPHEQTFFCVWSVEAEVNNGGFEQFYANSAGGVAAHVPGALRAIGAEHTAKIVEKANAVFGPDGPPAKWEDREEVVDELSDGAREELEELTEAFLEYRDSLSELLAAYMRRQG